MNAPSIRTQVGGKANLTRIDFDNLTLFYSYETIVAFATPETGKILSENIWSHTTGRHLNIIGGQRIAYDEFQKKLREALSRA